MELQLFLIYNVCKFIEYVVINALWFYRYDAKVWSKYAFTTKVKSDILQNNMAETSTLSFLRQETSRSLPCVK